MTKLRWDIWALGKLEIAQEQRSSRDQPTVETLETRRTVEAILHPKANDLMGTSYLVTTSYRCRRLADYLQAAILLALSCAGCKK